MDLDQLIIGGNFVSTTSGYNLASYDLAFNGITPLALADGIVHGVEIFDNHLYVAGEFNYLNSTTNLNHISKMANSLALKELTSQNLVVFPNPAIDLITVKTEDLINSIKIYNIFGQLVTSLDQPENQIDISGLSAGSFLIQVETQNGSVSHGQFVRL
jgi:hypothetical protein